MLTALLIAISLGILAYLTALVRAAITKHAQPSVEALCLGAAVNFFDTLGIGSFAPTTAWLKFRKLVPDRLIPPTMVVGLTPPAMVESLVFLILLGVRVDPVLLFGCAVATLVGGIIGAPLVARAQVWIVQLTVAIGLMLAAGAYAMTNLHLFPGGGSATGLPPGPTAVSIAASFGFGILANFGVGNYAPSLVMLSLMGMDPRLCFPIMAAGGSLMGAGASVRHFAIGEIDLRIVLGLAIGGIPAVLVAAFLVKSMPVDILRWLVFAVVLYTAAVMLRAAIAGRDAAAQGVAMALTDIRASNRDFEKYDQVQKGHTYRLAENESDAFDEDYQIAMLDFGRFLNGDAEDKARFAVEFAGALRDIGFAVLTGHGVDPSLYDAMVEGVLDLFAATPMVEKMRFRAERHGSVAQGYFPLEETSEIHPDLVEGWVWCRRAFDIPQQRDAPFSAEEFWPDAAYERRFRQLVLAHEPLFKPIAQAIFQGLGVNPHAYDEKLTRTNFGLRLNYYPPMTEDQDRSGAGRLFGHEDVDLFTILPATRVDGLQVWNHLSGKWVRMRAPYGSIIINTGDYMQRITNDVLPSTTHRVGKPTDRSHRSSARVSFPMAVYVWEDEVLEVLPGLGEPKYSPIKAITFHTRSTSKFYGDDYAVDAE